MFVGRTHGDFKDFYRVGKLMGTGEFKPNLTEFRRHRRNEVLCPQGNSSATQREGHPEEQTQSGGESPPPRGVQVHEGTGKTLLKIKD
jgi:hypothetical protein